jgi:hypothetical protein
LWISHLQPSFEEGFPAYDPSDLSCRYNRTGRSHKGGKSKKKGREKDSGLITSGIRREGYCMSQKRILSHKEVSMAENTPSEVLCIYIYGRRLQVNLS